MKSYRVRVAVALAAAGIAVTACGGPVQAGSAAIVGNERITSSQLNDEVRELRAALAANKIPENQLQLSFSLPQTVLLNMTTSRQFQELGRRKGVTVTDREVDDVAVAQGGWDQFNKVLLANGIPLDESRDFIRAVIVRNKLAQQSGAGQDQASQQAALQKVVEEADSTVPVKYSPRYGKFDPQQGFVADDRFGATAGAPGAGAPGAEGAGAEGAGAAGAEGAPQAG
ncbi:SurA N-terminal domain-containing protein [Microbispora sp. NPDC049633]|uniref:SurA N-terminal domain-containing protein n=1 Tax=Microbispora sp. NPDC049633 TaxID=3154355 RepID=UPI00341BC805